MSKLRAKGHSEVEYLRGIVKAKDKLIRRLNKQLKSVKKLEHAYKDITDHVDEETEVEKHTDPICTNCNKGTLKILDLVHVVIVKCDTCQHTERLKTDGEKKESPKHTALADTETKKRKQNVASKKGSSE